MAIEAFIGQVGGGKSFCSVRRMLSYIALGGRAVSNIELSGWCDRLQDLCPLSPVRPYLVALGWQYQRGQYLHIPFDDMAGGAGWFSRVPAGADREHRTLLVIDEATDLFDNLDRDKVRADSAYRALFRFLRLSRHAHIDVLFICQDISGINSRLRGLVCGGWRSTDMRNFRLAGCKFSFPFDLFMLQQFDRNFKAETRREWVRKDKRIFGLYQSESFGGAIGVKWDGVAISAEAGKVRGKKGMKKWERITMLASLVLSCVAIFSGSSRAPADGSSGAVPAVPVVCSNLATSPPAPVAVAPVVSPAPAGPSQTFLEGQYDFCPEGDGYPRRCFFNQVPLALGQVTRWGIVESIERFQAVCIDADGNATMLQNVINK